MTDRTPSTCFPQPPACQLSQADGEEVSWAFVPLQVIQDKWWVALHAYLYQSEAHLLHACKDSLSAPNTDILVRLGRDSHVRYRPRHYIFMWLERACSLTRSIRNANSESAAQGHTDQKVPSLQLTRPLHSFVIRSVVVQRGYLS